MGRTIAQIQTELDTDINDVITTPSTSQFAEWKIWSQIFAQAVFIFEGILDLFKTEIETTIQSKQPGTKDWYYDRALEFQGGEESGTFQGDTLIVNDFGILLYETTDLTRQIIEQCAIAAAGGVISFKVAKWLVELDGTYQALSTDEKTAFGLYIDNIKYPGTTTSIISVAADVIKYDLDIIYKPEYTTASIGAGLLLAADAYRQSLGFEDRFYTQKFIEALLEVDGVTSIEITTLEGKVAAGSYGAITIMYEIVAGYFNFDAASQFTYTDETTL